MPFDLLSEKIDYGAVRFDWDFPEFIKQPRTVLWYLAAVLVVVGLLIYALVTLNILFAVIIIIATVIIIFLNRKEPRIMNIKITAEGIVIENRFYPFDEIKNFWIVDQFPLVKRVYFDFKSFFIPRLSIPYQDQDPNKLKDFLVQYLDENTEREGEPVSEGISRWLKL